MAGKADLFARIWQVVRMIPPGQVATYGQIGAVVSHGRDARTVGWALHSLPSGSDVPWHRVVNARGQISLVGQGLPLQRTLLEREGVTFESNGCIDLKRYQWDGLDWPEVEVLRSAWTKGPRQSQ